MNAAPPLSPPGEADLVEAVARIIRRIDLRAAAAEQAKAEAERAQARARRFLDKNEASRAALLALLNQSGLRAVRTPAGTARLKPAAPKVILTGDVPEEFTRIKREPDKAAIREALLNDGLVLDFAEMSNGGEILEIRK